MGCNYDNDSGDICQPSVYENMRRLYKISYCDEADDGDVSGRQGPYRNAGLWPWKASGWDGELPRSDIGGKTIISNGNVAGPPHGMLASYGEGIPSAAWKTPAS